MTRAPDWPEIMASFIASRSEMAFAWGANDCCSFAADLGRAMGCDDLIQGMRGYRSPKGALLKLRRHDYDGLAALCDARLGERIPLAMAGRGDIALTPRDDEFGGALVVVTGQGLVGPGEHRMERYPLSAASIAWRMG